MTIQLAVKIIEDPKNPIYLNSVFRHDYLGHTFKDGSSVIVDGGNSFHDGGFYCRFVSPLDQPGKCENWTLTDKSTKQEIKAKLLWGTRGKKGDEPLKYVPLCECDSKHLKAILKNVLNINPLHKEVIHEILRDRIKVKK